MNRDVAIQAIRKSVFREHADELISGLRESVRIDARQTVEALLPSGVSRFGGNPDLPRGFEWPRWMGSHIVRVDPRTQQATRSEPKDSPLHFIAQIRVADLPGDCADGLPRSGWLCFFYDVDNQPWGFDPAERQGWRVCHFDADAADLVRTSRPQPDAFTNHPCALHFACEWTLPDWHSYTFSDSTELEDEDLFELLAELNGPSYERGAAMHRMLGSPQAIQGDMQLECQLASHGIYLGSGSGHETPQAKAIEVGASNWRLLLQIDSDEENAGWMWGDAGRIYYWIREQDLRAGAFDDCWFVLQCY
jgi:uncharacterized protein YwqG